MRLILAQPSGFCAGVVRAIEIVERTLEKFGSPVYVRHEIVHNQHVVDDLRAKGAVFVDEVDDVPDGAITIFSAHGVARAVEERAVERGLPVFDATCPLVAKVHKEAQRYARAGRQVVLIGHPGHPEVEGTSGRVDGGVLLVSTVDDVAGLEIRDPERAAFVTQTTLSVDDTRAIIDALTTRFPNIAGPNLRDICYATQNRQSAVRELAKLVDVLLVVGALNSSNSNRLREIGEEMQVPSHLIADDTAIDPQWFAGVETVGITAGASAPDVLVGQVIERLQRLFGGSLERMDGVVERVEFGLPPELRSPETFPAPPDPTLP